MKKAFSLILALSLSLSLCACGGSSNTQSSNNTTETTETTTEPTAALTVESVAGTYESILWCFHDSFTLNSNTTYEYKDEVKHTDNTMEYVEPRAEKGTFSITDNRLNLEQKLSSGVSSTLPNIMVNNCFYDTKWRVFEEDVDYGLVFSPDEMGMTDQTFESWVLNNDIPGSDHNYIILDLNKDGSFSLQLGLKLSTFDVAETYSGTYAYADNILTLTYEGKDYPLFVTEAGQIYFVGYKKV